MKPAHKQTLIDRLFDEMQRRSFSKYLPDVSHRQLLGTGSTGGRRTGRRGRSTGNTRRRAVGMNQPL